MGGKNSFLGIAYIAVGGLCVLMGVFFTLAHLVKPRYVRIECNWLTSSNCDRKLGDHTYLSWNNNDAQSTATSTGREARPGTQHG